MGLQRREELEKGVERGWEPRATSLPTRVVRVKPALVVGAQGPGTQGWGLSLLS